MRCGLRWGVIVVAAAVATGCADRNLAGGEESAGDSGGGGSKPEPDDEPPEPDPPSACGNGELDDGEGCDDGNRLQGDGCNNDCMPSGMELWTVTLDDYLSSTAWGVAVDLDDAIVVSGSMYVPDDHVDEPEAERRDALVLRLEPDGDRAWIRTWESGPCIDYYCYDHDDIGRRVDVDVDGNIVVLVQASGDQPGAVLVGYDRGGNQRFARTHERGAFDSAHAVAVDVFGEIIAGGYTLRSSFDLRLSRYDDAASEQWTVFWDGDPDDGGQTDVATGIALLDGGMIVAGYTNSREHDLLLARYTDGGDEVWLKTWDGGAAEEAFDVALDPLGNIIVAGYIDDAGQDAWIRKHDPAGEALWSRTFDGGAPEDTAKQDRAFGVAADSAGQIVVAGQIQAPSESYDVWVHKYDPDGDELWTRTHDSGLGDGAYDVAVDSNDNVVVVGDVGYALWVRKYTP